MPYFLTRIECPDIIFQTVLFLPRNNLRNPDKVSKCFLWCQKFIQVLDKYVGMLDRGTTIIFLLLFCGLLSTGCVSHEDGSVGTAKPEVRNYSPTLVYSGENQTYAYAKSLVPLEIPGFVLKSRAKEPMSMWTEPYHFRGYWTPENSSKFNGSVKSLSVDVFVYTDREEAKAWYGAFVTDSDGPLTIQGIDTAYRYRGGVAEIAFMKDDIIILSSSITDRSSPGSVSEEGAARKAAVTGAEMLINNIP